MTNNALFRTAGSVLLLLLLGYSTAGAGERTNVAGLGMGRTAVASSRGLDAVGINPANLVAHDGALVTLSILPLGVNVGSDFLSYDLYSEYFTGVATDSGRVGRYLTDADKQHILDAFTSGVGHGGLDFETRAFGLSLAFETVGAFAFTVSDRIAATGAIPQEYVQFLFFGNPPGSVYSFGETEASVEWLRDYALSFGMQLPEFPFVQAGYAGASVKIIHGFSYFALERFNSRMTTSTDGVLDATIDTWTRKAGFDPGDGDFTPFPAPGGTGLGFDLGVAADLNDYARVGLSVTDIGSITWKNNLTENVASGVIHLDNPLDAAQRDSVENAVKGEEREGQQFSSPLPTTLRMGVAFELHKISALKPLLYGELIVAADYTQGVTEAPGTSLRPRLSLGLEYSPWKFLPIRAGASFWGEEEPSFGIGLGFHAGFFEFDIAAESVEWLVNPGTFSRGAFAMGMKIKI
jgi:hypothetical protein